MPKRLERDVELRIGKEWFNITACVDRDGGPSTLVSVQQWSEALDAWLVINKQDYTDKTWDRFESKLNAALEEEISEMNIHDGDKAYDAWKDSQLENGE